MAKTKTQTICKVPGALPHWIYDYENHGICLKYQPHYNAQQENEEAEVSN